MFFYELHEGDDEVYSDVLVVSESEWEPQEFFEPLDYKNERGKFLDAFLDRLANWRFAAAQYEAARGGGGGWAFPG